ncbi:MAG: hypothetical protein R3D80_05050 [Paracoccaceae bacterium]
MTHVSFGPDRRNPRHPAPPLAPDHQGILLCILASAYIALKTPRSFRRWK